jgi:hypothetical protein
MEPIAANWTTLARFTGGQGSTIVFHLLTVLTVLGITHLADAAERPWLYPIVYLLLIVPFLYLQQTALSAGISYAHYKRAPHPRLNGALAVLVSWGFVWLLFYLAASALPSLKGNAYQFLYTPMSYTAYIPLYPLAGSNYRALRDTHLNGEISGIRRVERNAAAQRVALLRCVLLRAAGRGSVLSGSGPSVVQRRVHELCRRGIDRRCV